MKWLSFAFFYFSETGLFNGLQPIQIKKYLLFLLADGPGVRALNSGSKKIVAQDSDFVNSLIAAGAATESIKPIDFCP
jgi:hypothetical protein